MQGVLLHAFNPGEIEATISSPFWQFKLFFANAVLLEGQATILILKMEKVCNISAYYVLLLFQER